MEKINKLCDDIKAKMQENGFDKFVLYTEDYNGWDDGECEDMIDDDDEKYEEYLECGDNTHALGLMFNMELFSHSEEKYLYARKLRIKDDILLFDVSERFLYSNGDEEDLNYYKENTIENIINKCPKEMVEKCLENIISNFFDTDYHDIIELNKIMQHKD